MKNTLDRVKGSSGLTIVELLVSLFLVSLLTVFIISSYTFVQRFIGNWKNEISIHQEAQFLFNSIKSDLEKNEIITNNDSVIVFHGLSFDSVTYSVSGEALYRNGVKINSNEFTVKSVGIKEKFFTNGTPDSILIFGGYDYKQRFLLIKLILSNSRLTQTFTATMAFPFEKFVF